MKEILLSALLVYAGAFSAAVPAPTGPSPHAELGEVISNTTAIVGQTAAFYCEVIGSQTLGQELKFYRYNYTSASWIILSSDASVDTSYAQKYFISDKYRLNIRNVMWSDEGFYRCKFGGSIFDGSLVVIAFKTREYSQATAAEAAACIGDLPDPPDLVDLYWPGGKNVTEVGQPANLTCEVGLARPPPTVTWYRGIVDITVLAKSVDVGVDENGYGGALSLLELTPPISDEGVVYACSVNMPGFPAYVVRNISVAFVSSTVASTTNSPNSTTPASPPQYDLPQHSVRHNGTLVTGDSSNIVFECIQAYTNEVDELTKIIALDVNQKLGNAICSALDVGEMTVRSAGAAMIFQQNQAFMELDLSVDISEEHRPSVVEACSAEIANFVSVHPQWREPVDPKQSGCPNLVFQPQELDTIGGFWTCKKDVQSEKAVSALLYESEMSQVFDTDDGSVLSTDCTRAYYTKAEELVNRQKDKINSAISAGLCGADIARVFAKTQSFFAFQKQALMTVSFELVPVGDVQFREFLDCATITHTWLLQHSNWESPLLAKPSGCPALLYEEGQYADDGQGWICLNDLP